MYKPLDVILGTSVPQALQGCSSGPNIAEPEQHYIAGPSTIRPGLACWGLLSSQTWCGDCYPYLIKEKAT